jgi:two-component system alkaline phosphatase synthesis response regulator PhoP
MTWTEPKKILIIDDDKDLLEMYSYKFKKEGFEVFTEENGLSGITQAVNIKPDIILMDLMMPQMDGFETLKAFRQNTSMNVIIIAFSNLSQKNDLEKAQRNGADAFLVKSDTTPSQVVEKVKKLLKIS